MFNVKLYTTFDLLFMLMFSFKIIYKDKSLFLILNFQQMNSCEFKEIIISKDSEVENGMLGLERDIYLSIVKFLESSILRKV
jgi:hypothetical protein